MQIPAAYYQQGNQPGAPAASRPASSQPASGTMAEPTVTFGYSPFRYSQPKQAEKLRRHLDGEQRIRGRSRWKRFWNRVAHWGSTLDNPMPYKERRRRSAGFAW